MRRKIDPLKLSAIVGLIMLCTPVLVSAQTDPVIAYLCGSTELTLKPMMTDYTIQDGDQVIWQPVDADGDPDGVSIVKTGLDRNLVLGGVTSPLTVGEHRYTVHVIPADGTSCTGDVSAPYTVYQLPPSEVTIASTVDAYCEAGASNATPAILTATAKPVDVANTLPAGVDYEYSWSTTSGDLTTLGSASGTSGEIFTMTTTTVGTYELTATANYTVPAAAFFKSADSEGCKVTESKSIEVTKKPGQPTIEFE